MNTRYLYKIVYIDNYGDLCEQDFETEVEARNHAANIPYYTVIFKVGIIGSIERI